MSREPGDKLHRVRRRNPNHERSILLFNIIILCLITLTAIGTAAFFYLEMQTARTSAREMNDRLNGTNGQAKSLYTQEELDAQLENTRIVAEETGERDVKTTIQSALASGRTTLSMLRELFPEDVVVANQGRYYFYPVADELTQNTFSEGDFILDKDGLLAYQGEESGVLLTQGIQVSSESGDIDWEKVAGDHVSFAFIYVGGRDRDGVLTEDAAFAENIRGAKAAGLSVGIYYSLAAATTTQAQEDADWLIDLLEPYTEEIDAGAAILIQTPEAGDRMARVSRTIWSDNLLIVSNTLRLAGYQTILFGNLTSIMLQMEPSAIADLALWVSNVGPELYFPYAFHMWRYTADAVVDGIEEPVARSVMVITGEP